MAEPNPLIAQFAGGRQIGQSAPMQVVQGQGMAPGQVAQYLQGNALNIGQRLDGRANNMVESDVATDVRARERFLEQMDQQVYADKNAMERQRMQLQGQKDIAESNNALTRELGLARITSAEDMQAKDIESKEGMQTEALAAQKDIKQMGIDAQFSLQGQAIDGDLQKTQMVNESREKIAQWSNDIAKSELAIRSFQITGNLQLDKEKLDLEKDKYTESQRQFDETLEADIRKANNVNRTNLMRTKMQVDAQKYNVDKTFELKELEISEEKNKAEKLAPMLKDMFETSRKWQTEGRLKYMDDFERDYIIANAFKYNMSVVDTKGNIDRKQFEAAKQKFYQDADAFGQMRTLRDATLAAQDRIYEERTQQAFLYANKFGVDTGAFTGASTLQPAPQTPGNPLVPPAQKLPPNSLFGPNGVPAFNP